MTDFEQTVAAQARLAEAAHRSSRQNRGTRDLIREHLAYYPESGSPERAAQVRKSLFTAKLSDALKPDECDAVVRLSDAYRSMNGEMDPVGLSFEGDNIPERWQYVLFVVLVLIGVRAIIGIAVAI
jgi:hypothetical protein